MCAVSIFRALGGPRLDLGLRRPIQIGSAFKACYTSDDFSLMMQRASQIIGRISTAPARSSNPSPVFDSEQIACAAWARAVGAKLARHTRAAKLVRGRLVVEVEDEIWKRNLFSLSRHVMANLDKAIGPGIVTDIEFRVLPRRRDPQRALALDPNKSLEADEADGIQDPVLRRLYRVSRHDLRSKPA